jgi:hypothetical protein
MHGKLPILGFRIGDLAYLTDMKTIDPMELKKLEGVRHLIVNALHHTLHHSHMNLQQALSFIQRVQPEHAYLTHVSHRMGHYEEVQAGLPLAYIWLTTACNFQTSPYRPLYSRWAQWPQLFPYFCTAFENK